MGEITNTTVVWKGFLLSQVIFILLSSKGTQHFMEMILFYQREHHRTTDHILAAIEELD